MNRNNFLIHICIAAIIITFAAVLGQIRRWQTTPDFGSERENVERNTQRPTTIKRSDSDCQPEVLVKFRPNLSLSEIKRITAKNNDRLEDEIEAVNGLYSIDDLDNKDAETVSDEYNAMSDYVLFAEPNYKIELDEPVLKNPVKDLLQRQDSLSEFLPNDPMFAEQWALRNNGQNGGKEKADVSALKAWLKTQGSNKVVVAVLDTGVDYTHPDLVENIWYRPENVPQYNDDQLGTFNDLHGFNGTDNEADPMDENGHGTHCAGIIGAEGNNDEGIAGINWRVQIMPLKFLGRGGFGTTKDAIEAINYAIDRKRNGVNIRIISASWGSTQYSKSLEETIRAAGEEGILFIAAAGNSSTDNDKRPHYPSNYDLPNVISVAALDRNDDLASFSNFGKKTVHIAAPGKEILSTWINEDYREASGTSMATPYVSGVAALVLSAEPNLSVEKLRERLFDSVDPIDSLKNKVKSGGRINASKALGD